jgi:hypothetical protein
MAKAELKTRPTDASVDNFIASVDNATRRKDAIKVLELFKRVTGEKPTMWGPAIVGFGSRALEYASGRELDWPIIAFSPRKQNMTLYVICNSPKQPELLAKLGKHSTSVSCLYIKKLADVNATVLESVVKDAYEHSKKSKGSV